MTYYFLLFTAEKCIRASPGEDYTNGFFVALFVRKEVETEQNSAMDFNGVPTNKKRKRADNDIVEESLAQSTNRNDEDSFLSSANIKVGSDDADISSAKKRRKRKKKEKRAVESQKTPSVERVGPSNVDKKKKRKKKKSKKVPVCS